MAKKTSSSRAESRDNWAARVAALDDERTAPRRRKPPITVERIVQASLQLVAAEGFGALTMRRVAGVLETGAASLYAHVRDKAELDDLLIQQGNNNAYCQDTDIAWVDWQIGDHGKSLLLFTYRLIELRKRFPILHSGRFLTGVENDKLKVKDVSWFHPQGHEMTDEAWSDANAKSIAMLLDGRAQRTGLVRFGSLSTVLLLFNASHEDVVFTLPSVAHGKSWRHILDTFQPDDVNEHDFDFGKEYICTSRTVVLFELIS